MLKLGEQVKLLEEFDRIEKEDAIKAIWNKRIVRYSLGLPLFLLKTLQAPNISIKQLQLMQLKKKWLRSWNIRKRI